MAVRYHTSCRGVNGRSFDALLRVGATEGRTMTLEQEDKILDADWGGVDGFSQQFQARY